MNINVKRGIQMAASQVMRTGMPQWLAMKRVMTAERRASRIVDRVRRNTVSIQ